MFEKNLRLAFLLDFYGDVLDEHTRSAMKAYYEDDLSLAEIAEGVGISRQGVRHLIKKGEEQILFLEERLGLCTYTERVDNAAQALTRLCDELAASKDERLLKVATSLSNVVDMISNK